MRAAYQIHCRWPDARIYPNPQQCYSGHRLVAWISEDGEIHYVDETAQLSDR